MALQHIVNALRRRCSHCPAPLHFHINFALDRQLADDLLQQRLGTIKLEMQLEMWWQPVFLSLSPKALGFFHVRYVC